MTSMSPEQAVAQRQRAWRTDERKAVITAARAVIEQALNPTGDNAAVRALRRHAGEVVELLAGLNDEQREAHRHDGDDRDGDALLAAYVAALRAPRDAAKSSALQLSQGDPQRAVRVRRANAYTWAINTLRPLAEAEIATVRREVADAQEWLRK